MDRSSWGRSNSGKRTKVCPHHGEYEGFPATKCPTCKVNPPEAVEMQGLTAIRVQGKWYRVKINLEQV